MHHHTNLGGGDQVRHRPYRQAGHCRNRRGDALMAKAKDSLTPAQKRKATRERNKAKQQAAYEHRKEMFESMSETEMEEMTDRLDQIKYDFERRMEESEEEILLDLHEDFD